METDDPATRNVIFILAVMLERRRILVEKEVQMPEGTGQKIRVYEHKQTGESFVVPDPQLKLKEIETVQREVMELLGISPSAGKAAAAPAAAPAPAPEAKNG